MRSLTTRNVLEKKHYYKIKFQSQVLGEVVGEANRKGCWLIYGKEKQGKTSLALQLVRDMIKTPSASRRLGLKMSEQVKRWGEAQISSWLQEINDTESFKLNLHKIRSIPLLKELAAYDPDPKKNFDRAMALMCLLYQAREEISYIPTVDDKPKFIPFHQRGFFGRGLHRPPMATPR